MYRFFYLDNLWMNLIVEYGSNFVKDVDGKTKRPNIGKVYTTAASTEEYLFDRDGRVVSVLK